MKKITEAHLLRCSLAASYEGEISSLAPTKCRWHFAMTLFLLCHKKASFYSFWLLLLSRLQPSAAWLVSPFILLCTSWAIKGLALILTPFKIHQLKQWELTRRSLPHPQQQLPMSVIWWIGLCADIRLTCKLCFMTVNRTTFVRLHWSFFPKSLYLNLYQKSLHKFEILGLEAGGSLPPIPWVLFCAKCYI